MCATRWDLKGQFGACLIRADDMGGTVFTKRPGQYSRPTDGGLRPLEVPVHDGNVDRAIRILKREMGKEGILKTLKQKRYYEKPSEARKRKQSEALRRMRRSKRRGSE
tara:strand:- start:12 stop:335 length:324 start_codon:yes stop_codon:yes gene_type:complete